MARLTKEEVYATRRNAILDAAQRLIYAKGYEQMTIQDLLDELGISKGAFYHYFDAKPELLEALVERMREQTEALILPIARDPQLPALEKLRRLFPTLARWKSARKEFLLGLLPVLYADENAIFRQKTLTLAHSMLGPPLTEIIRQGVAEDVLTTAYPDQIGSVVVSLLWGMGETVAEVILAGGLQHDGLAPATRPTLERMFAAYTEALERILGAPPGSFPLMEPGTLDEWFAPSDGVEKEGDRARA
ncbi:MAG TPA: TetR/AcrR family transcriptional regulator [Ktedonobacterales bacterium]